MVAALAFLMRRAAGSGATSPRPADDPALREEVTVPEVELEEDDAPEDDDEPAPIHLSVTTDGVALVAAGRQVMMMDLAEAPDSPEWLSEGIEGGTVPRKVLERLQAQAARGGMGVTLGPGDLTGVRKVREAGAWRVETLGRDGEYGSMTFATEGAAGEAIALLERLEIVRRPLDDDRKPIPASREDFEEARRLAEETERDLALSSDDDEPPPSNEWSSRR